MIRSSWRLGAIAVLGSIVASQGASADSSVYIYANVYQNYEASPIPPFVNRDTVDNGPGATRAAESVTLASNGLSARTSGSATAIATEGSLWIRTGGGALVLTGHYDSQGNAYMPSQGAWADSEARASWSDMVTISDPSRAGQHGSAVALLRLGGGVGAGSAPYANIRNPDGSALSLDSRGHGRVSVSGNGLSWSDQSWDDACAAVGWAGWLACANAVAYDPGGTSNYSAGAATTIPVVLDFTFGQPFSLGYTVYANGGGYGAIAYYKMAGSGEGTGNGQLTLEWGGLAEVLDSSGNQVVSYDVSSDSGFDYAEPVAAPEPGIGATLMAGLVWLGSLRSRSRVAESS